MEEKDELFGKLFNVVPIYNQEHLDTILTTMDEENSKYLLIQAVKYAYHTGVYTIGEVEIISKAIRILSTLDN